MKISSALFFSIRTLPALVLLCTAPLFAAPSEAELLAVLRDPDASVNAQVTALQQLGDSGTAAAIPALTALLGADQAFLRDAARYALENIPDPSVEPALLAAAEKLSGPAQLGVVQSLGQIGSAKSVPALAHFLSAEETGLVATAAQSLGKIATPAALAALEARLGKISSAAPAFLQAADRLASHDPRAAAPHYRRLLEFFPAPSEAVRLGALRGLMLTGGPEGFALWEKSLRADDVATVDTALRAVVDFPADSAATKRFSSALAEVSPATQIRLAAVLTERGDPAANEALRQLALHDSADPAARFAAARALVALGDISSAEKALNLLLVSADNSVADSARQALHFLNYETPAAEAALGFQPMFNGENLDGWRGGDGWWSVVNGVLTAQSTAEKPCTRNSHLFWEGGEKKDFELRAEFRLSKDANSGIQLRARDANGDTSYQADMNGSGEYAGFLYHPEFHLVGERGSQVVLSADKKIARTPFPNKEALNRVFQPGAWNDYRIVAQGRTLTLYLNGVKTSEFTDLRPAAPAAGLITLQMHSGPPMKIEFRNLRLRDL